MNTLHIFLLIFAFCALIASNMIFGNTLLESHYALAENTAPSPIILAEE